MFAEVLSLHDGPRRACNKPRYPVSYVNLRIMRNLKRENILYMTFSVSVTVKSAFFLCTVPPTLLCPVFNDCFTLMVFLRNKHLRHKSQNTHKVKLYIGRQGLPDNRVVPEAKKNDREMSLYLKRVL